ncbi:SAM-dependent methyltransferase [Microbacterium mangrovi]|uniref:SAM-dependent methyltransferase n=1 Tax=Microbacterium mangrovi TaxID=1348253 RepID=A0A0B2A0V0_9MICO|nr:SAM-dependent methyltransferase [Microbacterium mangrovi]
MCRRLAADLHAAGFRSDRLRELWGSAADAAIGRGDALPARRAFARDDHPLATIARLFGIGDPVPAEAVAAAFPATGVAGLEALGAVARDGGMLHPQLLIRPQDWVDDTGAGQWWIASDLDEAALHGALPEDHVLGVGGASLTLAGLQLPVPTGRVLDLGTGCGIQALRARLFADAVVATDVSARALAITRLNALLNGVDGIDVRLGDMFAPVDGELFDRVVSNPPFVITPRTDEMPAYEYRDGGRIGDGVVASFVETVGRVLAPGGVAQLLGNWETKDGVDGLNRVRQWVAASGIPLDAWVIERERLDPVAYAQLWIRDAGTLPGSPEYDRMLGAWLDDFEARGVSEIGFGYVLLRRATGSARLARYERVLQPVAEAGLGAALARSLDAWDRVSGMDDAAVAASVLLTAPDVTEARHHLPGAEAPSVIELHQGGGFARVLEADPALAALVGACDGDLAVGVLIDAIAQLLDADAAALRADLVPRVRELLFIGMLRFAD